MKQPISSSQQAIINAIKKDQEELQKCIDDPLYFHNKYLQYEGKKELTQKEWDSKKEAIKKARNKIFVPPRNPYIL